MRKYKDEFVTGVFFLGKTTLTLSIYHLIYNVPQSSKLVNVPYQSTIGVAMSPFRHKLSKIPCIKKKWQKNSE